MKSLLRKKGTTFVEILIATTIFAMASIIAVTATIEISNLQYYSRIQSRLQEEANFVMEYIGREISQPDITSISTSVNKLTINSATGSKIIAFDQGNVSEIGDETLKVDGHPLAGGDVYVHKFVPTFINDQAVRLDLELRPTPRATLAANKSPYLGIQNISSLNLKFSLTTTYSVPD
ncbi:MAG: hypothetical protein Q7S37_05430 [bacterium]|nr:hypothetical protein [bacterium]